MVIVWKGKTGSGPDSGYLSKPLRGLRPAMGCFARFGSVKEVCGMVLTPLPEKEVHGERIASRRYFAPTLLSSKGDCLETGSGGCGGHVALRAL